MKFEKNCYFIADLHFGHGNIIKYDKRPFQNIQSHDETIILNWNNVVSHNDNVFIVGDFSFQYVGKYFHQLNGKKHLIKGNHDKQLDKFCRENDIPLVSYMEIKVCDEDTPRKWQDIILCHYPIAEWNKAHYGSWHVYGHTHGNSWYDRELMLAHHVLIIRLFHIKRLKLNLKIEN